MSENENIPTHAQPSIGSGSSSGFLGTDTTTTGKIDTSKKIKKVSYNGVNIPLYEGSSSTITEETTTFTFSIRDDPGGPLFCLWQTGTNSWMNTTEYDTDTGSATLSNVLIEGYVIIATNFNSDYFVCCSNLSNVVRLPNSPMSQDDIEDKALILKVTGSSPSANIYLMSN